MLLFLPQAEKVIELDLASGAEMALLLISKYLNPSRVVKTAPELGMVP